MSTFPVSVARARSVPPSLARPRAHLISLSTPDSVPLLVVDPRAGSLVDRHVRVLHGPELAVLAWSITGDEVLVLVACSSSNRVAGVARRLRDHTTVGLTALGHTHPWAVAVPVLPIRPHHDLGALVEYVLTAPVRAGLADGWPGWRWAGSRQWPTVCPAFLARHSSDRLWLDAVTANGSHVERGPMGPMTVALRHQIGGQGLAPAG